MSNNPPTIPGHDLLRCIGRGSYGEVWLARDAAGGFRAVKIVYRKTFEHDRPFERELSGIQKFEPISRSHPSQVSILQVGRVHEAGCFYYVMELADDANAPVPPGPPGPAPIDPESYTPRTLKSELAARGRLSCRECLDIGFALATALQHLHENGLIHRDIKPSNVIFVQGVPKLADIGLVTDVGATISFVGTEGFLPPEGPGTPQADLYSLGKVLYEISTGRDRMDFPEMPTFVEAAPDKEQWLELNQIILKACQNDARRRYQSARELLEELALLKSGKSLRRARVLEQRLARARLGAIVACALIALAALAVYLAQRQRLREAQQEAAQKQRESRATQESTTRMRHRLAEVYAANGEALATEGDWFGALVWFARALEDSRTEPDSARAHQQRIESLLRQCPAVPNVFLHDAAVNAARFSADGRRIITAGDDGTARVWRAADSASIGRPLEHPGAVTHAELDADGTRALTVSRDGVVRLWQQLDGEPVVFALEHPAAGTRAMFSPGGRQLLTLAEDAAARLWVTGSRRLRHTLRQGGPLLDAVFSRDGALVALAGADGLVRVWDCETGEAVGPPMRHSGPVRRVVFNADGRRLATICGTEARVWSARGGEEAPFVLRHDASVLSISFSPDGRRLLTGGEDRVARVWDAFDGRPLAPPLRHAGAVHHGVFSPDGRWLVTAGGGRVQLWDARNFGMVPPVLVCGAEVRDLQISAAGHRLLAAAADGTVRALALGGSARAPLPPPGKEGEWLHFARLWSGRDISAGEKLAPVGPAALRGALRALPAGDSDDSGGTNLLRWHRESAEVRERELDWFGAGFHWQRAGLLSPGDRQIVERWKYAESELALREVLAAHPPELAQRIPLRPPETPAALVDLSAAYNASLIETWLPANVVTSGNDLSAMPRGVQKFGGIEFDVRGMVQLSGAALENAGGRFPREVTGIRVDRKCRRVHFLHGAAWSALTGTPVAAYVVRYANGESREVRVLFGHHVREWWSLPAQPQVTSAAVAWEGANAASRSLGMTLRLYQMTWINPLPGIEIAAIDLKSAMERPALFVIAITAE